MANLYIRPSPLQGSLVVPPSKSHTMRAILFASLAKGSSKIEHFLSSPDTRAMIKAVQSLGAEVYLYPNNLKNWHLGCVKATGLTDHKRPNIRNMGSFMIDQSRELSRNPNANSSGCLGINNFASNSLIIKGFAGKFQIADDIIHCGNSGQVLRFIGALAGLIPGYTILTGDDCIRHQRSVKPLIDGLTQLGAFAESARSNGFAPMMVKGPFTHKSATIDGQDSQPVSGLLIAGAFAPCPIELYVTNPGEKPWIDLTLDWFKKLGIRYECENHTYYKMKGCSEIQGFNYTVPGDFSTAAFPIAASLLTHSELTLHNIDIEDVQGDKAIIPILEKMGAHFIIDRKCQSITVKKNSSLKGIRIDINDFIDALPILAVIGCFAEGKTEIVNGTIARRKESDRISAIARELKKMGAKIEEKEDGLVIHNSILHGAHLQTYQDHRLALSLVIAAMGAKGPSIIHGIECVAKTYPSFCQVFRSLGAKFS